MNFNYSLCLVSICGSAIFMLFEINPKKLETNTFQNFSRDSIPVRQEELITANFLVELEKKIKEAQRKTELLDDGTERILLRNKKWFFLVILLFIVTAYKSITLKNK